MSNPASRMPMPPARMDQDPQNAQTRIAVDT